MSERPMIHVRLPKELIRRIDHLAIDEDLDRGRAVELLLRRALAERHAFEADARRGE